MPLPDYTSLTIPKRDAKELDEVAKVEKCQTRPETIRKLLDIREEHKRLLRVMEMMSQGGRKSAEAENVATGIPSLQQHFMGLTSPV